MKVTLKTIEHNKNAIDSVIKRVNNISRHLENNKQDKKSVKKILEIQSHLNKRLRKYQEYLDAKYYNKDIK